MRRARKVTRFVAALVGAAAVLSTAAAVRADEKPTTDATGLATMVVAAHAAPTERLLDGTVEAVNQSTVSAQTAGRVTAIYFDVNDVVPAGALIIRIRSTEQAASLTQAQAALQEATAREAEAQNRYQRIDDMYQRRVVAKATYDEASAARDAAVARLVAARAGLEAAREGVSYTEIRAPYSGVVTQKLVQVGEAVAPGTPLMTGASLDSLRVVAEIPQSVIEAVRSVRKASVYAGGRRIESTGITIFPAAQPETSTFRARLDLPPGVQGLAPGMFVKVGLVVGESDRLLVPRTAVIQRSEMRGVYVVAPDGRVSLRQVRLGHLRGEQIEILAGLAGGERVALDPVAAGLRARQPAKSHD
ncbi:MAG: efflux RND transporter periplasmic adaptor subunit [Steroidobacteraceae bacterium]|nr:efflux RND transporter periplasmic adaptor subunit [Steroidobacteraceae bacterium]